jgi:hypothetical protein
MLGGIQQQLQTTYEALAAQRRELGYPVYALEHGLTAAELDKVAEAASISIRYSLPSSEHWLVWAALGAEAGYRYSGDEYWPALERRRGEWRSNDYRQRLRDFYRRFASDFGGPQPTGRWAGHFSIIAWPISGAILPRYLQVHFARHLFDLRYVLPHAVLEEGNGLGEVLLRRYSGTTSRFRDFLQQTGLTTQIVLALRDEASKPIVPRIEPSVLRRIVDDLERTREARTYLRDARHIMETTTVKIAASLRSKSAPADPTGVAATQNQRFRLVAKRLQDGTFGLGLAFPDFRRLGVGRDTVNSQRVQVVGDDGRWQPASFLLTFSGKDRGIDAFPAPNAALVAAEGGNADLANLLSEVAKIEERPAWVLRRHLDGSYREVVGGFVRADQEYLVLIRANPPAASLDRAGLKRATLNASGAEAFVLRTPARISDQAKGALKELRIGTKTDVSVRPLGISPRPGNLPSWLATETVILAASADADIKTIVVSLDGGDASFITCQDSQALIALEHLSVGRHSLALAPISAGGEGWITPSEQFEFDIIAPTPWAEGMQGRSGFRLIRTPPTADFESVVSGEASLVAFGPAGRQVHWSLVGYDAAGHPAWDHPLGTSRVGETSGSMPAMLRRACDNYSDEIDEAFQLDIVAKLDELGRQADRYPRAVEPLRWRYEVDAGAVRLVDETDHAEIPMVRVYSLASPLDRKTIPLEAALTGVKPDGEGGLFSVRCRETVQSIFVSAPAEKKLRDLADLGVRQALRLPDHKGLAAIRLIDGMRRWGMAKPVGHLALVRRDLTIKRMRDALCGLCCGADFLEILASSRATRFEQAQQKVGGSQGFGSRMRTTAWPPDFEDAINDFIGYAQRYGIETDRQRARAALIIAYQPLQLRFDETADKKAFFADLIGRRHLLRGAFLAHAVSRQPSIALKETA